MLATMAAPPPDRRSPRRGIGGRQALPAWRSPGGRMAASFRAVGLACSALAAPPATAAPDQRARFEDAASRGRCRMSGGSCVSPRRTPARSIGLRIRPELLVHLLDQPRRSRRTEAFVDRLPPCRWYQARPDSSRPPPRAALFFASVVFQYLPHDEPLGGLSRGVDDGWSPASPPCGERRRRRTMSGPCRRRRGRRGARQHGFDLDEYNGAGRRRGHRLRRAEFHRPHAWSSSDPGRSARPVS